MLRVAVKKLVKLISIVTFFALMACNPFSTNDRSEYASLLDGKDTSETQPFLDVISDIDLDPGESSGIIEIFTFDQETTVDCTKDLSVSSSHQGVVNPSSFIFSGTAPNCRFSFTGGIDSTGTAEVVISFSDGYYQTFSTFKVSIVGILESIEGAFQYHDGSYARSCKEYLASLQYQNEGDGIYWIDPDGEGGDNHFKVFCDMTTQGGGWTLAIKYDSSKANGTNFNLDSGAGRSLLNQDALANINSSSNLTSSLNLIPFIQNGATMLMHVGKLNDGAMDSSSYARVFFSEIYQTVLDNPDLIFNPTLDTNDGAGLVGTAVKPPNNIRKDRWFESDMTEMVSFDVAYAGDRSWRISGGEGDAMWTNGNREGALYASGNNSNIVGHTNPKVQWGFRGKDGSQQVYGGSIFIGTFCSSSFACAPESPINLMFVR